MKLWELLEGKRIGAGPGGICVCPKCGHEESHGRAEPCDERKCPECGAELVRKG